MLMIVLCNCALPDGRLLMPGTCRNWRTKTLL